MPSLFENWLNQKTLKKNVSRLAHLSNRSFLLKPSSSIERWTIVEKRNIIDKNYRDKGGETVKRKHTVKNGNTLENEKKVKKWYTVRNRNTVEKQGTVKRQDMTQRRGKVKNEDKIKKWYTVKKLVLGEFY